MSDSLGLFEHARGDQPRIHEGYCVDDVARGLVVLVREPQLDTTLQALLTTYLDFVIGSVNREGLVANRRAVDGRWTDRPRLGDWWGRAIWGLGAVVASAPDEQLQEQALSIFDRCITRRAVWPHSMAFAALGAAEVLRARPEHQGARNVIADAIAAIGEPQDDSRWYWPTSRLSYANGTFAEVVVAGGELLEDSALIDRGLKMLEWLIEHEQVDGVMSVAPVGGADQTTTYPAFDQQPIEVAAIVDACARAEQVTGDQTWLTGVAAGAAWFAGANPSRIPVYDKRTGGGFDGLHADGRNLNQGAESTLAALSTLQHAHRLRLPAAP